MSKHIIPLAAYGTRDKMFRREDNEKKKMNRMTQMTLQPQLIKTASQQIMMRESLKQAFKELKEGKACPVEKLLNEF